MQNLILSALLVSNSVFASSDDRGRKCEELAFRDYSERYKDDYKILRNIEYTHHVSKKNKKPTVLGEIDLLIVSRRGYEIREICEVKCSHTKQERAIMQLQRFKKFCLRERHACTFWMGHDRIVISLPDELDDIRFRFYSFVEDVFVEEAF